MGDDDSTRTIEDVPMRFGPRDTALLSGIERFTILTKLGEGGMGTVYAAYDSLLDRRVALKVVRADRRQSEDPVSPRDQLLREAQAMARLSHPNVVAIHEVGEIREDVFVVLELVDGATLMAWLAEKPRDWRTIVDAYIESGRGLAAAHAAGLVHRDFKP
ncbi:MAG TPA: protein kinase, partial [Kofleriaceae bacterium]